MTIARIRNEGQKHSFLAFYFHDNEGYAIFAYEGSGNCRFEKIRTPINKFAEFVIL